MLTAAHGDGKVLWPLIAEKLNKQPLFENLVRWQKARDHFNQLVETHKPKPKTGADDEPYNEMTCLLDDIKQRMDDIESGKKRKKDDAAAKNDVLVADGKKIRDAAMETLTKKPKTSSHPSSFLQEYFAQKGKNAMAELEVRKMELEERKAERLEQQEDRKAMRDVLLALANKLSK